MIRWPLRLRYVLFLTVASLLVVVGTGCSSSEPSTSKEDPAPPSGPALSMLYTTSDSGLVLHDARENATHTLVPGAEAAPARAVSPSGNYLALTYTTADSSHLSLLDLETQRLEHIHADAGAVTYSLAWHPESHQERLAFGHYRTREGEGRGPGGIQIAVPGQPPRSVGCNTVREVLHWQSDGSLAARTVDKLFVVATDDCATQASIDARRMHHIHHTPDGQQMAFIHRELTYDRSAGEYVPDSSLVLSDSRGENRETLFGDKRRVRHPRWAPDGSELAFDVAAEESGHRQVVVYDGNRPSFLTPPEETTNDQVHPRWSPSGNRLAFTLRTDEAAYAAVRMQGQTRRLGRTRGPVWGWLNEQSVVVPGPDSLRIQTLNGTTRFTHPTPAALLHVWSQSPS